MVSRRMPWRASHQACLCFVCHALISVVSSPLFSSDVTAITLSRTGMTTGRRSAPVPQMTCVGGPCRYAPSTVLCSNAGFDGSDVLWKCKADLEKGVKMGSVTVNCEGYDYPDDPYILKGSCGLEYTLEGQAEVERHQQHHTGHGYGEQQHHRQNQYRSVPPESSGGGSSLFWWIVAAALAYVIYKSCTGNGGGGGGGGGGGAGGPPPPNFRAAAPLGGMGAGPSYSGGSWGSSSDCAPPAPASSGPGFWSGMAGGSALGYMFGRNSHSGWNRSANYNASYSPSWGGGGGSGWSSSSSSSSAPSSMGTSSSSSFGGTRRR